MAPVAVPPNAGAIVALKVTEEFTMEGFSDEVSDIGVAALFTTCASSDEVLLSKVVLPK